MTGVTHSRYSGYLVVGFVYRRANMGVMKQGSQVENERSSALMILRETGPPV